jgi:hypothetical protein
MRELRQSARVSATQSTRIRLRRNTRIRTGRKIDELITVWVSSIIKMPLLNSLTPEAKLIQVTSTTTKYANKSVLSWLGGFFLHTSLGVKRWLGIGWVVSFGGFYGFLIFVVGGARNELGSTLLTLILTPLKANTESVCGFSCTLLIPTQVLFNHFIAENRFLKMGNQIGNLLL